MHSCAHAGSAARLTRLPLVTLYLSERCNSRCVTCDYWRHGSADMDLAAVRRLLPALGELGTQTVVLSGGEPLINREWQAIAAALRAAGLKLWLLTAGLSLLKHARTAAALFDGITVSLDGTDPETYQRIRGLDAFDTVCAGIAAVAGAGGTVGVRVTLQRANFRQLPRFVTLARELGARQVSFLAVDVANPHAFARRDGPATDLALRPEDLPEFSAILERFEQAYAHELRTRFVAETAARLRHIARYFAAVCGLEPFPPVRCNAPEFSAVIDARGGVSPCFFIRGPGDASVAHADLGSVLNGEASRQLRQRIRAGGMGECSTCVCSLWREPLAQATPARFFAESTHA